MCICGVVENRLPNRLGLMTKSTFEAGKQGHIVALSVDLIDRSKISAAFPDAVLVRSIAKLMDTTTTDSTVFVDLARVEDVSLLQGLNVRVIGFGSHVNEEQLAAARAVGVEAIPRSLFFRRLEHGGF